MVFHLWAILAAAKAAHFLWRRLSDSPDPLSSNLVIKPGGKCMPQPGFSWVSPEAGNFEVRWTPGFQWKERNLVAAASEREWFPAAGYRFRQPGVPGCIDVVWSPGCPHAQAPHVLAADEEGRWRPEPGWRWVSREREDLRVEPVPGPGADAGVGYQRLRDMATLGLEESATRHDIEAAFRRLIKLHHPDLFNGESEDAKHAANRAFVLLRAAYERLIAACGGWS